SDVCSSDLMQPVAHVAAVAVQRHRLAVEQVGHEQRDDLFRVLVRPVVVRAADDAHRQAVRAVVGAGQQVGRRLGRRVRRVRLERDRKSTRLNSSHVKISYAVFCLKKKKKQETRYCAKQQRTTTADYKPESSETYTI